MYGCAMASCAVKRSWWSYLSKWSRKSMASGVAMRAVSAVT